jgi:hypothetical protein
MYAGILLKKMAVVRVLPSPIADKEESVKFHQCLTQPIFECRFS